VNKFDWLSSSVGMSERLKIVRSPVRSRPQPQFNHMEVDAINMLVALLIKYGSIWRWALVGATTTIIDYIIFISLYSVITSVLVANFCAGLVSVSFNYTAHYFWSFKSRSDHAKAGIKYLINLITFWSISTLMLKALISAGLDPKIAKLIPIPIIAPLSFLSLRYLVFKKSKVKQDFRNL
jgi:putative flippase GtrA